ncbi:hypothetical protein AHAS_Ahas19G0019800 [Arachis hypogaea]
MSSSSLMCTKDPALYSFYVVAAESRVRMYVVRDHPFQHSLASPLFDPDAPYAFPLSWLYPDFVHHPFDFMHGGLVLAQQDGQAVPEPEPEPDSIIDDPIPEFPPVGSDMSMESLSTQSSDSFTIEPIEISVAAAGQP